MGKKKLDILIDCAYDELVPAKRLKPNPENPNTHTEEQVKLTAAIIKATKWRYAITVSKQSGMIVDGHCRYEAGLIIGDIKVPVDYQDFDSYEDEKAEMIRKNKLEELSEFSGPKLADILVDLDQANYDLNLVAMTQEEIDDIIIGPLGENPEDDIVPEPPKKAKTKTGDLIILGNHRLLCGDCTISSNVERLMGQEKADMVFTDTPYGINACRMTLGTGKKQFHRGEWDKRIDISFLLNYSEIICIWGGNYFTEILPMTNDWLCWHKKNDGLSFSEFELAWTNFGTNSRHISHHWSGEEKAHPTQKPLAVMIWGLSLAEANIVLDLFLGSGSTLIACEKLNRRCFGMEIDPIYCDVIVERWEKFTNKKAKRPKKVA